MKKIVYILVLIIGIIIFIGLKNAINNGITLSKINCMYEDIKILDDKIALYYLDYGYIPVKDKIEFNNSVNPNDGDIYYEIDINKLDNIYLNYGMRKDNSNDYYIINEQSHTIYYFGGINYKNEKQYTRNIKYTLVDLK